MQVWHAMRRWKPAAIVCICTLFIVAASSSGAWLRLLQANGVSPEHLDSNVGVRWRLLFCPPLRTPASFDYLALAWLRAASLVNATAPEGPRQRLAPLSRKRLQSGPTQTAAAASTQLTPAQLLAVRRYASWSPGSVPWRDAAAIYVRVYKCGNDAFTGALLRRTHAFAAR